MGSQTTKPRPARPPRGKYTSPYPLTIPTTSGFAATIRIPTSTPSFTWIYMCREISTWSRFLFLTDAVLMLSWLRRVHIFLVPSVLCGRTSATLALNARQYLVFRRDITWFQWRPMILMLVTYRTSLTSLDGLERMHTEQPDIKTYSYCTSKKLKQLLPKVSRSSGRKSMRQASSLSIRGTASVLKTEALFLSPAVGLLVSCAPQLVANLRRFPPHYNSFALANELFYQRVDKGLERRFGPISPSNSKSNPAFWLSTRRLGVLLGIAMLQCTEPVSAIILSCEDNYHSLFRQVRDKELDILLQFHGIRCNYVDDTWTGISLARYRKLIKVIAEAYKCSTLLPNDNVNIASTYSLPIFLGYVWDRANSKNCLLDFLLAVEETSGKSIFSDSWQELREAGSPQQQAWLVDSFRSEDLSPSNVRAAAQCILRYNTRNDGRNSNSDAYLGGEVGLGQSLEVLAASLSMERAFKPSIKLGRYSCDGGPTRPDCVEVVVREIVEGLLFGMSPFGK